MRAVGQPSEIPLDYRQASSMAALHFRWFIRLGTRLSKFGKIPAMAVCIILCFNGTHWWLLLIMKFLLEVHQSALFCISVYDAFSNRLLLLGKIAAMVSSIMRAFIIQSGRRRKETRFHLAYRPSSMALTILWYDPFTHEVIFTWEEIICESVFLCSYMAVRGMLLPITRFPWDFRAKTTVFRDMVFDTGSGKLWQSGKILQMIFASLLLRIRHFHRRLR